MTLEKTGTKLHGYGGNNIPVVGKITVKCEFCDAEEQLEFYIVKTDNKTVLSLQTCKSLRIIQILNEVKSQKQYDKIEDKMQHQTNGGDESEIMTKVARIGGKSGKKQKEEVVEMHPELFKDLGRMEPELQTEWQHITDSTSTKEDNNWFTWKAQERIGQHWENRSNKESSWNCRISQFNGCDGET